jgi:hypothetical protein
MKTGNLNRKNICKNEPKKLPKNYIYRRKRQKPFNIAFWGRFHHRNSAKESSHNGEKFFDSGDGNDDTVPPRQSCVQSCRNAVSCWRVPGSFSSIAW